MQSCSVSSMSATESSRSSPRRAATGYALKTRAESSRNLRLQSRQGRAAISRSSVVSGHPLTKESFGNDFKEACVAAGILDRSAHVLRKLSATLWAERGASEHELMSLFGWLTPSMAALYTRKAGRRNLALNAHDRLSGSSH
jgi:integrase